MSILLLEFFWESQILIQITDMLKLEETFII